MNPGFKSRIPDTNIYIFDDFTEAELMEIAENYLKRNNYTLSSGAQKALITRLKSDHARRDKKLRECPLRDEYDSDRNTPIHGCQGC